MDSLTLIMIIVMVVLFAIAFRNMQKKKGQGSTASVQSTTAASNGSTNTANGYNGQISFDGKNVVISRKGAMAKMTFGFSGEKKIPLSSIISVQYKEASMALNGFIQFATAAGENVGSLSAATQDENSVIFTKGQSAEFSKLRDAVDDAIEKRQAPGTTVITSSTSVAEQLEKLVALQEKGILTQEEFNSQKNKLLNG